MVHVPLFVSDKFKGKSKRGLFGDVVMEVDWSVGQILAAINDNMIWMQRHAGDFHGSDNGPWLSYGDRAGTAAPLREGKGTMFEGGCREPTVMRWPGTDPRRQVRAMSWLRRSTFCRRSPALSRRRSCLSIRSTVRTSAR